MAVCEAKSLGGRQVLILSKLFYENVAGSLIYTNDSRWGTKHKSLVIIPRHQAVHL